MELAPTPAPAGLPETVRDLAIARYRLVHAWRALVKTGDHGSKRDAAQTFLRAFLSGAMEPLADVLEGLRGKGKARVSVPTLYRWDRALREAADDRLERVLSEMRTAERWTPARFIHRDPRFFVFDRDTGNTLRLIDDADPVNGVPLAPFKWIVHKPRLRTGMALRGGIARVVAWAHLFKSYTIKDWMAFCEVFGMPLRVGKYGPNATVSEKTILLNAVANLGTDAAAIIPESMQIEFVEAAKVSGGQALFEKLADWLDNQVTKYILGQTGTTSGTPGRLGNEEAQNEVRHDIRDADAGQLAGTLDRDLVRPFIDLNFGPQRAYPRIVLREPAVEDLDRLSLALDRLVPIGLRVSASEIRDKFGLADPGEDEEVLVPFGLGRAGGQPSQPPAENRAENRAQNAGRRRFTPNQQALEDFADSLLALGEDALAENERRIVEAVLAADSYEDAMERVLELYPDMDVSQLRELSEIAIANAQAFGMATVAEEEEAK
ncbi:MAG: DUF935 family protein [Deltaproteobacteria bacterium]|nr:DUF935 family protein [Deltaproteobacteria bacterium]